jgi:hypothetical protein
VAPRHALFPLVLAACAATVRTSAPPTPPHSVDLWVSDSLPHAWVDDAVVDWQTHTAARFTVHFGQTDVDCERDCWIVNSTNDLVSWMVMGGHSYWGYTQPFDHTHGHIWIVDSLDDWQGRIIVTHELGHALGLEHREPPIWSVMNPAPTAGAGHVTCDDVSSYNTLYGITTDYCTDGPAGPH